MGCFSGRLMTSASDQKWFCEVCSAFSYSFDEFIGEKVVSPSYSSAILAPPHVHSFKVKFVVFFFKRANILASTLLYISHLFLIEVQLSYLYPTTRKTIALSTLLSNQFFSYYYTKDLKNILKSIL